MKNIFLHMTLSWIERLTVSIMLALSLFTMGSIKGQSTYLKGDFHQHSTFTDGSWTINHVFGKNNYYGLDWWVNSEHGGGFNRHGLKSGTDLDTTIYWDQDSSVNIMGTLSMSGGHRNMWRWQSLRDYSFPVLNSLRGQYYNKLIIQGYEMNVPGHEHGSVAVIGSQLDIKNRNVNALSQFEYMFDNSDQDTVGGLAQGWIKCKASCHAKTLEAATWLQNNHLYSSWLIPAHPERQRRYSINHFRDMNNVAPDVCFGFESMPGHQKGPGRGGYSATAFGGTFGGCGYFAAKVGGLWDAMLSEGRNWWLFASSDFHDVNDDFYPGEYQKTYTLVGKKNNAKYLYKGLRTGNSWVVTGDLIDDLKFKAYSTQGSVMMGQTLELKDSTLVISVKVHDPLGENYNTYSEYNKPSLDHIDLIAGYVHEKYSVDNPLYNIDTVATTKVIARFDRKGGTTDSQGITSTKWINKGNGWYEIFYLIENVNKDMYFRLRGTNLSLNVANETDGAGNPMADALMGPNDATKAFADLWFYSNPIFVKASKNINYKSTEADDNSLTASSDNSLNAYPNPATDVINISNPTMENTKVTVYDFLTGERVKELSSSSELITLDIKDLSSGLYLVTTVSGSTTRTTKIVKR